jgi:glycosyltransferase involved in cell wall biosynthesis
VRPRIAIVVHGRFYAFDLARELLKLGAEVVLFTNYPKMVAERFGVGAEHIRSFLIHGLLARLVARFGRAASAAAEPCLHRMFGRWAARRAGAGDFDVLYCFSGVAEETFRHPGAASKLKVLVRASAHIATQRVLLDEEERRAGIPVEKPSNWAVERECREYAAADRIVVLSSFARATFTARGVPSCKLWLVPLGVRTDRFELPEHALEARLSRIASGAPLRVLTTGSFTLQKGAFDYAQIAGGTSARFVYRWVGDISPEAAHIAAALGERVQFVPRVREYELAEHYAWADVFLFPSIQDGFAAVLVQAQAAGLPILATANCGAPDIVHEAVNGWIVPARQPEAFVQRLVWCDSNREAFAALVSADSRAPAARDWDSVAGQFVQLAQTAL